MSAKRHIAVCVTNDLCTDQRVARICSTLVKHDFHVTAIGRKLPTSGPVPLTNVHVVRMRLLFKRGAFFYLWFNIRLMVKLLMGKYEVVWSNDLDTLPGAYLAAKMKGLPLIFDSHELFSEVPELKGRAFVKSVWRKMEKRFIPKMLYGVTVSTSIANYYRDLYGVDFTVIRNVPKSRKVDEVRGVGKPFMIYQGSVNLGRGIELMIKSLEHHDLDLVICGAGDVLEDVKQLVVDMELSSRVHFTGKLLPDELQKWTAGASVGLSLEADMGLNYRFALPNKVFDYIHAGIPVIVSNLPEMRRIVHDYRVGEVLEERTPQALADVIEDMLTHERVFKDQAMKAADQLNWDHEEEKLQELLSEVSDI